MTRGSDRILWSWKGSLRPGPRPHPLRVAASLALAAAETPRRRDVLSVVGAAPTMLRRPPAPPSMAPVLLGAVLGIPVGFLPGRRSSPEPTINIPLVFPWRIVVLLVVLVQQRPPSSTTLASGSPCACDPVTISTMAFE